MDIKDQTNAAQEGQQEPKKELLEVPIRRPTQEDEVFERMIDAMIPPAYQEYDLRTLKPDTKYCRTPVEFQQFVIDMVKAKPQDGYAFFGPPGCGKTTLKNAMLREAIRRNTYRLAPYRVLYSTKMPQWVLELENYKFNRAPAPHFHHLRAVTIWKHEQRRSQYFLDEFDKCGSQEFINLTLMEFIDTLSEMGDKISLVICTNMKYDEFLTRFGDHIMRRVEKMCKIVNYHAAIGEQQ
jgi:hypothetical protein